jgi:hypothetical protein
MAAMTIRPISLIAALCLAGAASCGWAQPVGPAKKPPAAGAKPASATAQPVVEGAKPGAAPAIVVKPAASAPVQVKRQTRPLTAAEKLESVAPPGELRPERTIKPQITIPLTKTPPKSIRTPRTSTGGSVNDAAGRCAAIADENERAQCRAASVQGKPKP